MAEGKILRQLVRAGTQQDGPAFRQAAEQVIKEERAKKHHLLAFEVPCNQPPACAAGGPYVAECVAGEIALQFSKCSGMTLRRAADWEAKLVTRCIVTHAGGREESHRRLILTVQPPGSGGFCSATGKFPLPPLHPATPECA